VEMAANALDDPLAFAQETAAGLATMLLKLSQNPLWRAAEELFRLHEALRTAGMKWSTLETWINTSTNPELQMLKGFIAWVKPIVNKQPFEPFAAGNVCGTFVG